MPPREPPRELGDLPLDVIRTLLLLEPEVRHEIIDALHDLCADPYLRNLREENGVEFIIAGGHVVSVDVDDETVTVVDLALFDPN